MLPLINIYKQKIQLAFIYSNINVYNTIFLATDHTTVKKLWKLKFSYQLCFNFMLIYEVSLTRSRPSHAATYKSVSWHVHKSAGFAASISLKFSGATEALRALVGGQTRGQPATVGRQILSAVRGRRTGILPADLGSNEHGIVCSVWEQKKRICLLNSGTRGKLLLNIKTAVN